MTGYISKIEPWHKSVVYQIYPKSFLDTTGNGTGDLRGIIRKLDYLQHLGVDYLWLTPVYPSPQHDNGYDVADYCAIEPAYGNMDDFEELVQEAESRGMGIMLDMVFNHTSTEHIWFQKALEGDPKYLDYYIFRDPVEGKEPTNWQSKFGGNAWEFVPSLGQYYLHLFDVTQADLNWENPEVQEEIYRAANFWLDKGVRGFRLDVINLISKPDQLENDYVGDGRRFYTDGPRIHEFLKELNRNTFGQHEKIITVGEMSSTTLENCIRYSNPEERELSMTFNFHHLKVDYPGGEKWKLAPPDFQSLKKLFNSWQTGMTEKGGWNALFWCNHDQPRVVSRLGDDTGENRLLSAKMFATLIHLMRGTPYIYQGEELGMTNAGFSHIEQYRDVESLNHYQQLLDQGLSENEAMAILAERSRDNARTPIQWDNSPHAGFTEGKPWLEVADNYQEINARQALEDENSILNYYRDLIRLRKEYDIIAAGNYIPLEDHHNSAIFAYRREYRSQNLMVICNLTGSPAKTSIEWGPGYHLLINNYHQLPHNDGMPELRPWESLALLELI